MEYESDSFYIDMYLTNLGLKLAELVHLYSYLIQSTLTQMKSKFSQECPCWLSCFYIVLMADTAF